MNLFKRRFLAGAIAGTVILWAVFALFWFVDLRDAPADTKAFMLGFCLVIWIISLPIAWRMARRTTPK